MAATGTASTAQQRRFFSWLGPGPLVYGAAILLSAVLFSPFVLAQQQPQHHAAIQNDSEICKSVDIRNTLDTFKQLEGCRVVEGFVQILLFDNVNETQLSQISFPELTEITDYLLLYRVNGLRSVGQLFPNLSVIRGQNTFFNYALVVFEMSSLQEIALYSLTDITHGLVRIDKNPSLCFVNSINWEDIAHEKGEHFIKNLKPANECPICPAGEMKEDEFGNSVQAPYCPKAPHKPHPDNVGRDKHLCWNRQHCQKKCPAECGKRACNANRECCNENCLGGCSIDNVNVCTVCRNLSMGFGTDRNCITNCPTDYYEYLGRRCVKYEECITMRRPIDLHSRDETEFPYKIFNNASCILHCPTDYMNDNVHHVCKPCEGRCKKDCPGFNVDSITLAKQLRGCTNITGSLEIQIRGGNNVVKELEENLSMIEEITGYLKIVRSFPLVSLNFLKSLKRIRGSYLESQKYALVVIDNQNLQDLWDWENRTFQILNPEGKIFFHFNPKLCLKKIEILKAKGNLPNYTDLEVAPSSNGDKIACNVAELKVEITNRASHMVVLKWKQFDQISDQRKLLAYIVYLIEAPYANVTLYDGRDACGGDGWRVDDVPVSESDKEITHPLTVLKPYTQYAFYVKTYTIATETKGAQSKISYFRTRPAQPSIALHLQVISNRSDALKISWKKPERPNGNVTHYIVTAKKHKDMMIHLLDERNYCNNSPATPAIPPSPSVPPPAAPANNDTCLCDEGKAKTSSINEGEEESRIRFEDQLQNEVYVKKPEVNRRKREVIPHDVFPTAKPGAKANDNSNIVQNKTENGSTIWENVSFKIYGKTEFYVTNLHHFTVYDIYIQACRESEGTNDEEDKCSNTNIKTQRTLSKDGADDIKSIQITNQSLEIVSITWKEPEDPNGVIFSYTIEYKRIDHENSKAICECITHSHFLNQSRIHTLRKLPTGNYSLKVFATTSAGNGADSPIIHFYIEESTSNTRTVVLSIICTLLAVLSVGALAWCYKSRKSDRDNMRLIPSVNPEYVPSVYVPDEWEVPRKSIELIRELGQGSFGMVYEGLARDIRGRAQVRCAVKTVNEHSTNRERLEFLNEASVMKAFDTSHVVRLLGVVSQGQPTLVIMELMANGDLKSYLRSHRPDIEEPGKPQIRSPPTLKQSLQMAIEIADGMAYLSAKKFVHRDLAARNCMVAEDLTVKIGDFGMTRDIYETDYYRKGTKGLLPVRWMAPESLKDGVFTSNSDVWSYGVVLWEMATLASQPYQGLSNDQVLRYVIDGGVMERPENCPDKLYTLMRHCWQHKPTARPSFLSLCSLLIEDASPNFARVSFYHSAAGTELRNLRQTPTPSQDDPSTPLTLDVGGALDSNFSINSEDDSDDDDFGSSSHRRIHFPNIPPDGKDGVATANGYVGGCPTNGAATTQC